MSTGEYLKLGEKMKKFPFFAMFAALLMALASTTVFAQFGGQDDFDPAAADLRRNGQPEKHIQYARHHFPDLNSSPGRGPRGFALTTGGTTATTPITYHGGPVMGTPEIYLIFYGNWNQANGTDTPAGQQIVRDWAAAIGTTSRYLINDTYDTPGNGNNVSGNAIYNGRNVTLTGSYNKRLRDSQILAAVDSTILSGALGPFNPNGVYFLITSSDVTATSGFCTQYCGWHSYSVKSYGRLKYSFIGNAARCLNGCAAQAVSPNGNAGVDGSISILTHELEEAHTDPELNAWYDAAGAENSDKCAWTFGHFQSQLPSGAWYNVSGGGRNFLIQRGLKHIVGTGDFCMQNNTQN